MASLNICQFIGNVGADPEIRTFDGGGRLATFRIAVTERYTDRNNNQQERTEWVPLVFNGKLVDIVEKYVRKGSSIYVQGKWHTREWTDQQGGKHQSVEVSVLQMQLLDKKESRPQTAAPAPIAPNTNVARPAAPAPVPPAPVAPPQYQAAPAPPQPQYQPAPAPQQPQFVQSQSGDLPFNQSPGVRG